MNLKHTAFAFIAFGLMTVVALLSSSCATVLPESHSEHRAITHALESHYRAKYPNNSPRVSRVEATSRRAIAYYGVINPPDAQMPCVAAKARLVKYDGEWVVRWTKADVSLLQKVVVGGAK